MVLGSWLLLVLVESVVPVSSAAAAWLAGSCSFEDALALAVTGPGSDSCLTVLLVLTADSHPVVHWHVHFLYSLWAARLLRESAPAGLWVHQDSDPCLSPLMCFFLQYRSPGPRAFLCHSNDLHGAAAPFTFNFTFGYLSPPHHSCCDTIFFASF